MNNDIDSLLNSIFTNGRITASADKTDKTSQDDKTNEIPVLTTEPEPPVNHGAVANAAANYTNAKNTAEAVSLASSELTALLEKQLKDMDALNRSVRQDISDMSRQMKDDGLITDSQNAKMQADTAEPPAALLARFEGIAADLKQQFLGQDNFINQIVVAFKRPYVMGADDGKAKNSILITGRRGTGKHTAIDMITKELHARKVLKSGKTTTVDLSLYPGSAENKLFLQDMYIALHGNAEVVAFDNFNECHPSYLAQLAELVQTGHIRLSTRYVLQKGILVEAGTALIPSAVSTLDANGKYLIFFCENGKNSVANAFGAKFINALGDICETGNLDEKTIAELAQKQLDEMCLKCKNNLGYTLEYTNYVPLHIAKQFTAEFGIDALHSYIDACYRAFCEYRLQQSSDKPITVKVSVSDKKLMADFGNGAVALFSLLPGGYSGDLDAVKQSLADIVGLTEIKDYILSLEENCKVQAMRKAQGLKVASPSMHMIFTGNPGTGKTTIARLTGQYLKAIGALSGGQLVEVSRADLVGKYVGHTAPLTNNVIQSAIGGVLFIDEAYSLYRGKDDSFGLEAIDTLVKGMEDNRDDLVVILAGYSDEMQQFLTANSGLKSRFPNIIEFPDYTADELLAITKITCKSKGYRLDDECDIPLLAFYDAVQKTDSRTAGNGRLVRNKVEEAILNQSRRVVNEKEPVLDLLKKDDFELDFGDK